MSRSKPVRTPGFTLAEALVTLALVALAFGVVGTMISNLSSVLRRSGQQDRALDASLLALNTITQDLHSAINVSRPAGTTPDFEVEFQRLSPYLPDRLPPVRPSPGPASWSPHRVNDRIKVRYYVSGTQLRREITWPGPAVTDEVIGVGLNGISARRLYAGTLELTTTTLVNGQTRTLTTQTPLHLPAELVP